MAGLKRNYFLNKGFFNFFNFPFFTKKRFSQTFVLGGMFSFGLLLVALSFALTYYNATKLSFTVSIDESMTRQIGTAPTKIFVPKEKLELPMLGARIVDNRWEIKKDGASFITSQNTIIAYAHNKKDKFGFLKKIKAGDFIYLQLQNGNKQKFEVYKIKTVSPSDINALFQNIPNSITLYTCTGFADSKRLVVSAKPITEFSISNNL